MGLTKTLGYAMILEAVSGWETNFICPSSITPQTVYLRNNIEDAKSQYG